MRTIAWAKRGFSHMSLGIKLFQCAADGVSQSVSHALQKETSQTSVQHVRCYWMTSIENIWYTDFSVRTVFVRIEPREKHVIQWLQVGSVSIAYDADFSSSEIAHSGYFTYFNSDFDPSCFFRTEKFACSGHAALGRIWVSGVMCLCGFWIAATKWRSYIAGPLPPAGLGSFGVR